MFHDARLQLTAWYLLIIMLVSIMFSIAFYHLSTREVERIITRIEFRQQNPDRPMPSEKIIFRNAPTPPSLQELENSKKQIFNLLVLINAAIFIFAGGAGYFLAGRTLRPIKIMIDEQNQFISSASHELRTPLATLRAEMEGSLLEKQISDKKARELIISNLEELGTLQDLSKNLLQIAHIHNSSFEKSAEALSLFELIKIAEKKVMPLAKKKHITISLSGQDADVLGDKRNLTEVFVILLDNAIKYSLENTKITITTMSKNQSGVVSITDQGIGIAKKDIEHIFDRFYRADTSRSQAEGFGLGLSIAKAIVEKHNGSIRVESKENKPARNAMQSVAGGGTTFTISLPLKTA